MAATIQIKNSVISGKIPSSSDLILGELALNAHSASPALYFKDNANNIIALEPGSGVEPSPNPPGSPSEGDLWYDTNKNSLNYWNGTGWIELGQAGDSPVTSVNGEVGVVVLDASDVGAATEAQGIKADSALQPGDDNTQLNNAAGFITLAEVPAAPVDSVNTKTGVVVLTAADVGAATEAQGLLADSALQPGGEAVLSVNTKTGVVVLTAADVGALPDTTTFDFVPLNNWSTIPELV